MNKKLAALSLVIILLSALQCVVSLLPGEGESFTQISSWGEEVMMQGRGVYARDSLSLAVQALAQDWVTLILGIPLMVVSLLMVRSGNYRGKLLHTGVMGYFLYTYMSYSFLVSYNSLFLLYVSLFSLSLFGFIFSFASLDISHIIERIKDSFPRRSTAGYFLFIGIMLLFMWLGRIIPSLLSGEAPYGLEIYTTLVIQVMDLALIVPVSFLSAYHLLKNKPLGYALSMVIVLKGVTLFTAISFMALLMKLNGVEIHPIELIIFPTASVVNFGFCFAMLKSIRPKI